MTNDSKFKVGDLVKVNKDLYKTSPTLRFFHNKIGMIIKKESEEYKISKKFIIWGVMFPTVPIRFFKDYELKLIAKS